MTTPTTKWTRLARLLGSDHNPLRRRSDRVAAWLLPGAIVAFGVLSPVVATGVGLWVHADNAAAHRAEQSWHRVSAVLLRATPGPMLPADGGSAWLVLAPARWTAAGRTRIGLVPANAGTPAGGTVPVWLDRAGAVQVPPPTAGQVRDRLTVAAAAALAALAVVLAGLALLGRWLLDRRRLADWETAWLAVGPQWSRQQ